MKLFEMPAWDSIYCLLEVFSSIKKEQSGKLWKNDFRLTEVRKRFGVPEAEARKTWYRGWERDSTLMLFASQVLSVFGYPQARF
jgi:hypothetical protein